MIWGVKSPYFWKHTYEYLNFTKLRKPIPKKHHPMSKITGSSLGCIHCFLMKKRQIFDIATNWRDGNRGCSSLNSMALIVIALAGPCALEVSGLKWRDWRKNRCFPCVPWSRLSRFFGDKLIPPFDRNPYNGYINPYYWVDEFIP